MQSLRILLLCIAAAVFYGIIHDQITARICIEYFTVFHPNIFHTRSPTWLGIGWGIVATWWVGALLGLLLAAAARGGSRPKLRDRDLLRPILKLLVVMAGCATVAGLAGFSLSRSAVVALPARMAARLPQGMRDRFVADWWAHLASYATGLLGGIVLCVITYRRRRPRY